jgi:hypothetical protein
MRRREFIVLFGCSVIAKPKAASAQQMKPRQIGFLRVGPPPPTYIGGFRQGLQEDGLVEGREVVMALIPISG